jgi:hypothetical protein
MRTLRLTFPVIARSGSVLTLSVRFQEVDVDDLDEAPGDEDALPVLITCGGREFEPTDDGAYRARGGGPVVTARDARYRWPQLCRLAELALRTPH